MKRRDFSMAAAGIAAFAPLAWAQGKKPEDGIEYRTLNKPVAIEAPPGKVEVVNFFWYSCPHCYAFEPALQAWMQRLPPDISLRRIPANFRDEMVPQQRMFYALEAMGKVEELQVKIFDAIHKDRVELTRLPVMADWVAKQGVDAQKFSELYSSFAMSAKARRATEVQDAYGVEGVPSFGIAGRWYTDRDLTTGNNPRMVQVVEYLAAQARKTR